MNESVDARQGQKIQIKKELAESIGLKVGLNGEVSGYIAFDLQSIQRLMPEMLHPENLNNMLIVCSFLENQGFDKSSKMIKGLSDVSRLVHSVKNSNRWVYMEKKERNNLTDSIINTIDKLERLLNDERLPPGILQLTAYLPDYADLWHDDITRTAIKDWCSNAGVNEPVDIGLNYVLKNLKEEVVRLKDLPKQAPSTVLGERKRSADIRLLARSLWNRWCKQFGLSQHPNKEIAAVVNIAYPPGKAEEAVDSAYIQQILKKYRCK